MQEKIHINKDINQLQNLLSGMDNVFVVIDNNLQHLAENFKGFPVLFLDSSEKDKTLSTVEKITSFLMDAGADRGALLIGVGGGITTDITGFAASIYKRGIKCAFVPTTLLAQVDASIGGKNGVNFQSYKNILGTITQPQWICIIPPVLATLPENEFKAGIAEALKTFILFDKEHYRKAVNYFTAVHEEFLRHGSAKPYGEVAVELDEELLTEIVGKCAQYKCGVVQRDEFERGERRMLNLGHTFAHSIEKLTGGDISHGFAVSMGMVIAAKVADAMGVSQKGFTEMLIGDLSNCGLPALPADCPLTAGLKVADLADAVRKDKKVAGKNIHFILPKGLEDVEDILLPLDKLKKIADDLR